MHMNIYYFNVTNAEEVMADLATMDGPERIKPRYAWIDHGRSSYVLSSD